MLNSNAVDKISYLVDTYSMDGELKFKPSAPSIERCPQGIFSWSHIFVRRLQEDNKMGADTKIDSCKRYNHWLASTPGLNF
jgi:hypothetical protein